jgi:hypothetical protein
VAVPERPGQGLEPIGASGRDDDGGAEGIEDPRRPHADSRAGPGDEGHPAVEAEEGERVCPDLAAFGLR